MSDLEHDLALISEALDESISWIPSEFDNAAVCLARDGRNALDRLRSTLAAAQTRIAALEQALVTCDGALDALLKCPEIADCAPEDKDPETEIAERFAREARAAAKAALDE